MARITFTIAELLEILASNQLLPPQITRVKVKGDEIHFVIKTNAFILPYIPASLKYLSFDDNNALFELAIITGRADKAVSLLNDALKLKLPAYMKLEYPNLFIDVGRVLRETNVRGIQVEDISYQNGEFTIVTRNA
ncbi:MAG: hypothetical protein ACYS32_04775 [Planctomycetota bacterium]|jgi:hypothetical protein